MYQNEYQTIEIRSEKNGVCTITLNKPEIHNTFDDILISELTSALKIVDESPSIRLLILAANGKSFSAGADLNWMRKMAGYSRQQNVQDSLKLAELMSTLYSMKCPTIASVQGAAFGGGVGLIACCDIAIATEDANFSLSEVKLGLIPAVISPYVIKAIGERTAKRYFITAERFNAEQAKQFGLISEIVRTDELQNKVSSIGQSIVKNGPESVLLAKALIKDVTGCDIDAPLISMTAHRIADVRASSQGIEGVNAFLDKRKPIWEQKSDV